MKLERAINLKFKGNISKLLSLWTMPIPAAVSRFRLSLCKGTVTSSYKTDLQYDEMFSLNIWSSGIWISTATGSTAAMSGAGGFAMDIRSRK
jgi:NAD+ kinase